MTLSGNMRFADHHGRKPQKEASDPKSALNELGADGWELAGTIEYTAVGKVLDLQTAQAP